MMATRIVRRRFGSSRRPLILILASVAAQQAQQLQKITINYPTRSGASWPMYIAKEGGYYQKYGLDVDLQFGVHPAGVAMLDERSGGDGELLARAGHAGRFEGRRRSRCVGSSLEQGHCSR